MSKRNWLRCAALAAASCGIGNAQARNYYYRYVSANYSVIDGAQCLTTSMHLKLWLILAAPLPANASDLSVQPVSWRANDGLRGFSSKNRNAGIEAIQFWTDGNGNIVNWVVALYGNSKTAYQQRIIINKPPNSAGADFAYQDCARGSESDAIATTVQTWKQPPPPPRANGPNR